MISKNHFSIYSHIKKELESFKVEVPDLLEEEKTPIGAHVWTRLRWCARYLNWSEFFLYLAQYSDFILGCILSPSYSFDTHNNHSCSKWGYAHLLSRHQIRNSEKKVLKIYFYSLILCILATIMLMAFFLSSFVEMMITETQLTFDNLSDILR
ncbi:MAG: hypothetical protein ACTSRK_18445 [Promethearchaeota archaeon]